MYRGKACRFDRQVQRLTKAVNSIRWILFIAISAFLPFERSFRLISKTEPLEQSHGTCSRSPWHSKHLLQQVLHALRRSGNVWLHGRARLHQESQEDIHPSRLSKSFKLKIWGSKNANYEEVHLWCGFTRSWPICPEWWAEHSAWLLVRIEQSRDRRSATGCRWVFPSDFWSIRSICLCPFGHIHLVIFIWLFLLVFQPFVCIRNHFLGYGETEPKPVKNSPVQKPSKKISSERDTRLFTAEFRQTNCMVGPFLREFETLMSR